MSVSRPFQSTHHFVSPPIVGYVATPDAEEDPSISRGVLAPEFKGRVKLLLQRIVEDNQPHLVLRNRIVHDELYPRWMKYASFRENKLKAQVALLHASDERAFSTRPEGYCELAQHDRKFRKIEILECRLVPAIARCINWSEGNTETCVDLAVLTLDTLDGVHFAQLYRSLCTFSAHALGRFYQRAFSNSDEAAIDSMWSVLPAVKELLANGALSFACEFAAGGAWRGYVGVRQGTKLRSNYRAMSARSFYSSPNQDD